MVLHGAATCSYRLAEAAGRLGGPHHRHWRTGMSDHETVAEIELHNVKVARMLVDYWRRQGVEIGPNVDPTKALRAKLGPNVATRIPWRRRDPGYRSLIMAGPPKGPLTADAAQLMRVMAATGTVGWRHSSIIKVNARNSLHPIRTAAPPTGQLHCRGARSCQRGLRVNPPRPRD